MRKTKAKKLFHLFIFSTAFLFVLLGVETVNKFRSIPGFPSFDSSGKPDPSQKTAIYEGKKIDIPELAYLDVKDGFVLGENSENKWVEVDLSEQKIRVWNGDSLFLESLVSTGLPWTPTPQGEFRVWAKFRATKMEGGSGRYYYNLPNVPYVMFFENSEVPRSKGYSLHGTYWHHDFGKVHSHGCINLPTPVAEKIYNWIEPQVPQGKYSVRAMEEDPGTRIVIHE